MKYQGLPNYGNTCYINSTIQLLLSTQCFQHILTQIKDDSCIITVYNDYKQFLKKVQTILPLLHIHEPNDVHEFLTMYISNLHDHNKISMIDTETYSTSFYQRMKKKCNHDLYQEYSLLRECMFHQVINQIECGHCNKPSLNIASNITLDLEISDNNNIQTLIQNHFSNYEFLDGWKCSKCNSVSYDSKSVRILWRIPELFFVCVKRFKYDSNRIQKLRNNIEIPIEIDLENSCLQKYTSYKLNLHGVINHLGTPNNGHYNVDICDNKNRFIRLDDDIIHHVDTLDTKNCYVICYEFSPQ